MGLRCLIGHDFDAPDTVREREERGDDVVVTVREFKECRRCGHQHVISENKEVRAGGAAGDPTRPDPAAAAPPAEPVAEAEEFRDVSADEDDGMILEDGPVADRSRERGAWPPEPGADADDGAATEHEWPAVEGEDEGYDAGPSGGGPAEGVTFRGGGLTPEPEPDATDPEPDDGGEILEGGPTRSPGGSVSPAADPEPEPEPAAPAEEDPTPEGSVGTAAAAETADRPRPKDDDLELLCPACEHATPAMGGSLRSGDICPECRRGYLVERVSQ